MTQNGKLLKVVKANDVGIWSKMERGEKQSIQMTRGYDPKWKTAKSSQNKWSGDMTQDGKV